MNHKFLTITLVLSVLLFTSLPSPGAVQSAADEETQPFLVEALLFYRGYNVGHPIPDRTNGPKKSAEGGKTWIGMAWPDLKCFSVDISEDGKWVYVGAGNGVFVSRDGGRSWKVTGGHPVAEAVDVRMSQVDPEIAWAGTAYGLFLTKNAGENWTKPGDQPFGFVSSVCPVRSNPGAVWIGAEKGLYLSDDWGKTYRRLGPDAIIRSIWQDTRRDGRFWVGTDGQGLWRTNDHGRSWERVEGPGEIVNRVKQHPTQPERIYTGCDDAPYFSLDSGLSWTKGTSGDFTDDTSVYAIAFDPSDRRRIYAGCRGGFFESRDEGLTWKLTSQQYAVIYDLEYAELYTGKDDPGPIMVEEPKIENAGIEFQDFRMFEDPGFAERVDAGIADIASRMDTVQVHPMSAVAVIKEGLADEEYYRMLGEILDDPGHSMFWSMPAITLYLHCSDLVPAEIKEKLKNSLVVNSIYRGDTENHWVMYHTALLLTAQSFPEVTSAGWYNGQTSRANYEDAKSWLNEWFQITAKIGQGEFDSPAYYMFFIYPMQLLYDFAKDEFIRHQAGMMLDLLLADAAADSLNGRFCGGHSRLYDRHVRSGDGSADGDFFYLYFGGDHPGRFNGWSVASLYSSYRCPKEVFEIANRRDEPFVNTEIKRVRNMIRYRDYPESPGHDYGGGMNPPVFRYNYMTPDYCLGSLHGGILQPIQQHTWDVTWISEVNNSLAFSLHPYWSGLELAMFFPEDPHMLTSSVAFQKSGYTDQDKWTSSSPYERVFQLENTLIAAYNVPESGTFPNHADLYLPKCLNHEIRSGWIFGRDGDFYLAIRPLVPGVWREHEDYWRYTIPAGQAGFVVETGRSADDVSFERFVTSVLRTPPAVLNETLDGPEIRYENRHGRKMVYLWDGDKRLMDEPVTPFPSEYLYYSPLMESEYGSGIVSIFGDGSTRVLDFNRWKIETE